MYVLTIIACIILFNTEAHAETYSSIQDAFTKLGIVMPSDVDLSPYTKAIIIDNGGNPKYQVFFMASYSVSQDTTFNDKSKLVLGNGYQFTYNTTGSYINKFTSGQASFYKVSSPMNSNVIYCNFTLMDSDGGIINSNAAPVDIGYPLNFRYFVPGMYGQSTDNALLIGNNLHQFQATWKNKDDTKDYHVQIQYKGTYMVKREWIIGAFSKYDTCSTEWHDIAEVPQSVLHWWEDEVNIDYGKTSPIYIDIKTKVGYEPSLVTMKQTSGTMRIRYLQYNANGDVIGYGKWVSECIKDGKAIVVVTEEDGTPVATPEYGETGTDVTGEDLNPDAMKDIATTDGYLNIINTTIKNIGEWIGEVPVLFQKLFLWLPEEMSNLLVFGLGIVIILRIMGR
jgi:hypothetical protein